MSESRSCWVRSVKNVVLAAAVLSTLLPVISAHAGVQDIKGDVTDPRGTPINGARVSDGLGKTAFTGTSGQAPGRYLIEEMTVGTYQVSVTKAGFNAASQSVDPVKALGDVDFTLAYTISGSVTPNAFRMDPAPLIEIRASSQVPPAGTCVTFTDLSTGGTTSLAYDSMDGRWEGNFQIPTSIPDGTYSWTLRATDCSSGIALSSVYSSTYVVDGVAPVIDSGSILPAELSNAAFQQIMMAARVLDLPSGVDVARSGFSLESSASTSSYPAVSYDPSTGWMLSALVPIVRGQTYRVGATASDFAGNTTTVQQRPLSEGRGFLATGLTLDPAEARINEVACSLSEIDLNSQKRTVTCPNVALSVGSSSAVVHGTNHVGTGYAEHTVSLDSAKLIGSVLGASQAIEYPYSGLTKKEQLRFDVAQASLGDQTVSVSGTQIALGTYTRKVDPSWTSARLLMDPVLTSAGTTACADPSVSTGAMLYCLSDPLENDYIVRLDAGADVQQTATSHQSMYGVEVLGFVSNYPAYRAIIPPAKALHIAADSAGPNAIDYLTRSLTWKSNDEVYCSAGAGHRGSLALWLLKTHPDHFRALDPAGRGVLSSVFEDTTCVSPGPGVATHSHGPAGLDLPGSLEYEDPEYDCWGKSGYCIYGFTSYDVTWGAGFIKHHGSAHLGWDTYTGQAPPGASLCSVWTEQTVVYRDDFGNGTGQLSQGCAGTGDGDNRTYDDWVTGSGQTNWLGMDPSLTANFFLNHEVRVGFKAFGAVKNSDGSSVSQWACYYGNYHTATGIRKRGGFCVDP